MATTTFDIIRETSFAGTISVIEKQTTIYSNKTLEEVHKIMNNLAKRISKMKVPSVIGGGEISYESIRGSKWVTFRVAQHLKVVGE